MPKRVTSDAVEILDNLIGDDVQLREMVDVAFVNAQIAQLIYNAREEAGLTQARLAKKVGHADLRDRPA